MSNKFIKPIFKDKNLEFRYENNEICIYGTKEGFKRLSDLIIDLMNNPRQGHIHLEDYGILTEESLIGAIAIFDKE